MCPRAPARGSSRQGTLAALGLAAAIAIVAGSVVVLINARESGCQRRSITQSMLAHNALTSAGSTLGYMPTRSWLRPSLR